MAHAPGQGRKPKSTHLKLVRGETNKDRLNTKEPKPIPKRPPCPSVLQKEDRKMWRYLAPQLERTGQLTRIDLGKFASYCRAYGRWIRAERMINEKGVLYKTGEKITRTTNKVGDVVEKRSGGSITTSPYLWIANKCISQMDSLGSALGLDPASRSRLIIDIEGERDEFEDLLD